MKARNDDLFIFDIVECCRKIESYLSEVNENDFLQNPMLQDAVVRNIEIIGEAAKNLTEETRNSHSAIGWRDIMRMRDKIAHHYFRINIDVVWQTAKTDIPELLSKLQQPITESDENHATEDSNPRVK